MPAAAGLAQSYELLLLLRPAMWLSVHGRPPGRDPESVDEHAEIVERIIARDLAGALAAISEHVTNSAASALAGLAALERREADAAIARPFVARRA